MSTCVVWSSEESPCWWQEAVRIVGRLARKTLVYYAFIDVIWKRCIIERQKKLGGGIPYMLPQGTWRNIEWNEFLGADL